MVEKVGALRDQRSPIFRDRRDRGFHRLFAEFLRDLRGSAFEQLRRVRRRGIAAPAGFDRGAKPFDGFSEAVRHGASPDGRTATPEAAMRLLASAIVYSPK